MITSIGRTRRRHTDIAAHTQLIAIPAHTTGQNRIQHVFAAYNLSGHVLVSRGALPNFAIRQQN